MVSGRVEAFSDPVAWRKWLDKHQDDDHGIWLKIAKKGSGVTTVTYAQALDVALCFGWIDGQKAGLDEVYFLQHFTPRRARSIWSKINVAKAEALISAGQIRPRGQAEIDKARADGRWDAAYAGQKTAEVPEDLQAALQANPAAKDFFATLSSANRYAILFRIGNVKRAETRANKIEMFVEMLARGEALHPQK